MERPKYHRLPGRHTGWLSRDSLWSGDDHLLWVQNNGFVERYRRYSYADIQGFTVRPSPRGRRITILLAVPFLLLQVPLGLSMADRANVAVAVFFGILSTPLLLALAVHWIRGSTCTTHLCTAVADVVLLPLGRQRTALRTLILVAGFVDAAQGKLDPTMLGFSATEMAPVSVARKVSVPQGPAPRATVGMESGSHGNDAAASRPTLPWQLTLGGTELLFGASSLALVLFGGGTIRQAAFFAMMVLALLMSSLSLARGGDIARKLGICALVHAVLVGATSYLAFCIVIFRNSIRNPSVPPQFDFSTLLDPSTPAVASALWMAIAGALWLSVWGFLVQLRAKQPG